MARAMNHCILCGGTGGWPGVDHDRTTNTMIVMKWVGCKHCLGTGQEPARA